jgi:hypothetical protein
MSYKIKEAIDKGINGFLIKDSIFLPFHMELISIWIGKDMSLVARPDVLTNFGSRKSDVVIREGDSYTNLIFIHHKELKKEYGHYKGHIILHAAEKGADIFDPAQRHYIKLSFHDDTDNVYLELIDDPFEL